jgi:hypothetical protein
MFFQENHEVTLSVRAVFNDTGTNTFCWPREDANPPNDFQAVLSFSDLIGAWTSTSARVNSSVRQIVGQPEDVVRSASTSREFVDVVGATGLEPVTSCV